MAVTIAISISGHMKEKFGKKNLDCAHLVSFFLTENLQVPAFHIDNGNIIDTQ